LSKQLHDLQGSFRNIPGVRAGHQEVKEMLTLMCVCTCISQGFKIYTQYKKMVLPLMLFENTSGNSDNWLRIDTNIGRIESNRGGSAS
jgi:hypothetical protein